MSGGSAVFGFASTLVRLGDELPKPNAERLREYRDTALPSLYNNLYTDEPIYPFYETTKIENGLLAMAEHLGGDDPAVVAA
ncbi:S46 family peptidase, partial [Escherichia coli]|uniref:S46 family peptidase n=1 Tax=Escherichia coli TaxID=562 RepID=UPI0021B5A7BD